MKRRSNDGWLRDNGYSEEFVLRSALAVLVTAALLGGTGLYFFISCIIELNGGI